MPTPRTQPLSAFGWFPPGSDHWRLQEHEFVRSQLMLPPVARFPRKTEFSMVTPAKSGATGEKSARLPTKVQLRRSPCPAKSAITPQGPVVWLFENVEFSAVRMVPSACKVPPITAWLSEKVDFVIRSWLLWT